MTKDADAYKLGKAIARYDRENQNPFSPGGFPAEVRSSPSAMSHYTQGYKAAWAESQFAAPTQEEMRS